MFCNPFNNENASKCVIMIQHTVYRTAFVRVWLKSMVLHALSLVTSEMQYTEDITFIQTCSCSAKPSVLCRLYSTRSERRSPESLRKSSSAKVLRPIVTRRWSNSRRKKRRRGKASRQKKKIQNNQYLQRTLGFCWIEINPSKSYS